MKTTTSFEHIAEIWDAKTGNTGQKMISAKKVTAKHIIKELGPLKGKKIYEIACGNGFLARQLAPKVSEMRASDVSKTLIDFANTRYSKKNINYEVRDGVDFKGIPKNHFDTVIIHQGIFYIENLNKLAKGIFDILKPGGELIFSEMHPLMYMADADTYSKLKLKDLLEKYHLYLRNRKVQVNKKWFIDGKMIPAQYHQMKRPISTYVNIFGKHGLLVSKMIEPATINMIKGKVLASDIPSSWIVKCVKVKSPNLK